MADIVATQTLVDNDRVAIMKFTCISDGGGETKVTKVNVSTLAKNAAGKACNGVNITKIHATTHGLEVMMYWDADTDVFIWMIPQNSQYTFDFTGFGGLKNNANAGSNGNILFSTIDANANDMYTIVLEMIKTYAS